MPLAAAAARTAAASEKARLHADLEARLERFEQSLGEFAAAGGS